MTEQLKNTTENSTEKKTSYTKILTIGGAAIFATWLIFHEATKPSKNDAELNAPTAQEQPARCASTWEMTGQGHDENGDWIEGGINTTNEKGEKQNPRDVINNWVKSVNKDNTTLEYLSESVYKAADNSVVDIDPSQLVTNEGCASDSAVSVYNSIKDRLDKAEVSYGLAPESAINSRIDEHNEVQKTAMPENRESIVIDFKNGNFLYILINCGNLVINESYPVTVINQTVENHVTIIKKKIIIIEKNDKKKDKKDSSKSSNTNDYKNATDKTKVTESSSADKTAPKVEKSSDSSDKPDEGGSNSGNVTE
ncbi:MAG: hypothetical protein WA087_00445 [Candidatus Saccharimonadales bacterium]